MVEKFKNFDVRAYLDSRRVNEDLDAQVDEIPEIPEEDSEFSEDEVITGTAVYEDQYLKKIANIIKRHLTAANIGKFGIYHDIVYLNGVPGVWFYGIDDNERHVVCCRDTNRKYISVFREFNVGGEYKALVTYSTEKFGFKDMIDQLIEDLKSDVPVNEELLLEAGGFGDGYSAKNIANFKKLPWSDKEFMYKLVSTIKKGDAILEVTSLMNNGDRDMNRILLTFGSQTAGSCKYIVGLANDILSNRYAGKNPDFDDLVREYNAHGSGAGPAIAVNNGIEYEVTDEEVAEEERQNASKAAEEARLKEDLENYEETLIGLKDTTEAMCNYVKQHGKLDREDKSVMARRGVLLTGKGGIGKTHTLKQVLKEKNMKENTDYVWISSDSTTSDALYTTMYEFNGKLIIFDDAPKLFEGDYRISMWKNALQTDLEDCKIGYPKGDSKLNVYNVRRLKGDRQRQYFMEIGRKSGEDKNDFYKKEMKKYGLKYSKYKSNGISSDDNLSDDEINSIMSKIDDLWKEEEDNTQPSMPNNFIFTGCVIIISNDTREKFEASVGKGGWEAIQTRFRNFDISPLAESLWSVIKKKILTEYNDKSLADDFCSIPRNMTMEFIEEVEKLITDTAYQGINWRTIRAFGDILRGQKGLRTWKRQLRDELATK